MKIDEGIEFLPSSSQEQKRFGKIQHFLREEQIPADGGADAALLGPDAPRHDGDGDQEVAADPAQVGGGLANRAAVGL